MIERAAQGADRLPALVARGRRVREMLKRADHRVLDTVGDRDAKIANFGSYASPERRLVADLNDFDEPGGTTAPSRDPAAPDGRRRRPRHCPGVQEYVEVCGALLARAHSQSPAAAAITGYLAQVRPVRPRRDALGHRLR